MEEEVWRQVRELYEVSNLGNVRRDGRVLRIFAHRTGYTRLQLTIDGKYKTVFVHQLVAEAFLGPRPEGCEVNHKDGNKKNACATNLEYVTRSENKLKAIEMGLVVMPHGEGHPMAKLTEKQVAQIRRMAIEGMSQRKIAKEFDVSQFNVWRIVSGKGWK